MAGCQRLEDRLRDAWGEEEGERETLQWEMEWGSNHAQKAGKIHDVLCFIAWLLEIFYMDYV